MTLRGMYLSYEFHRSGLIFCKGHQLVHCGVCGGASITIEPPLQCFVARVDSALEMRTSLARLEIVVLRVFPTQSTSLLDLRIPSMSKYPACPCSRYHVDLLLFWLDAIGIEVFQRFENFVWEGPSLVSVY